METAEDVLDFWFGGLDSEGFCASSRHKLWFGGKADADIQRRFGERLDQALAGRLTGWGQHPASLVALITLLDQFSRNIYRGKPEAFSGDALAQQLVNKAIAEGVDREFPASWRIMFYLPLEHAENLADQNLCVAMYELLLAATPISRRGEIEPSLDWARRHRDIVARFGRFPHRNQVMQREATVEENAWLANGGDRFGQ